MEEERKEIFNNFTLVVSNLSNKYEKKKSFYGTSKSKKIKIFIYYNELNILLFI